MDVPLLEKVTVFKDGQKVKMERWHTNKENADNVVKTGKNVKLYAKWKKQGKRRALILGETSTTAVPMLDVTSMKKMMKNCKFYGKKMDSIITYPNHTKKEITNKIKKTFKNNKSNDVSYIYMTCHGKKDGRVCIGSDDTSYSVKELRKLFDKNIKGKVVFLLDCCYAGNVITKKNISVVTKQDRVRVIVVRAIVVRVKVAQMMVIQMILL